jgi:hypothetical protein
VKIVPRPEVDRAWAEHRAEVRRQLAATRKPDVIGAGEAARLFDKREFVFRGRAYRVGPLNAEDAFELLELQDRIARMAQGTLKGSVQDARRVASLSKRVARPAGFLRRLLWPLTPNPFRKADPWEVGRNLGFFSTFLVLDANSSTTSKGHPGTSSPTYPRSSNGTRRGATARATRSRGPIS